MTKLTTKQQKEKQALLNSAKNILGYFDYWAGYPAISQILRRDGDFPLKYGKLTTGFELQQNSLKQAIKEIDKIKDANLTVRYRKHEYSVPNMCHQILKVLKLSLKDLSPHHDNKTHDARMSLCSGHDSMYDKNGVWKPQNINDWAMPLVKTRRKSKDYVRASKCMQAAENSWLDVTSQDEEFDNIYFANKNTLQMVSSNEIYNLLTKDFPW